MMKMRSIMALAVMAGMAFALANPVMAEACGSCHTENNISNPQFDLVTVVNTDTSSNTVNLAPAPADPVRVNTDNDLPAPAFGADNLQANAPTPSSEVGGPGSSGESLGASAPTPDERMPLVT